MKESAPLKGGENAVGFTSREGKLWMVSTKKSEEPKLL
jgi:hypothetical protein